MPSFVILARLMLALLALTACSWAQPKGHGPEEIRVEGDALRVTATRFFGSEITYEQWEEYITRTKDPFGAGNKTFWIRIEDQKTGKSVVRRMIPADNLYLLDDGRLVVVLADTYPTSGAVVLDRAGNVLGSLFDPCFGEGCVLVKHHGTVPWYDARVVSVRAKPGPDGRVCNVEIAKSPDEGAPTVHIPICSD